MLFGRQYVGSYKWKVLLSNYWGPFKKITSKANQMYVWKQYVKAVFLAVVVAVTSACSAEKSLEVLSYVSSSSHYEKTADITYGPNARQKMDFYKPIGSEQPSSESGVTVVFVYGGAWRTGDKNGYEFVASSLTKAGHRVLIPDYRLYPEVRYPDFVNDVAQAIAVFEQLPLFLENDSPGRRTSQKLVLVGHSSGAHQVAMLFTDPTYFEQAGVQSTVTGLIGLSGPYDLPLDLEEVSLVFDDVKEEIQVNPVLQANAMTSDAFIDKKALLLHGEEDERVLPFHTPKFAQALKNAGASVDFHLIKGGHAGTVLALSGLLSFLNDSQDYTLQLLEAVADVEASGNSADNSGSDTQDENLAEVSNGS